MNRTTEVQRHVCNSLCPAAAVPRPFAQTLSMNQLQLAAGRSARPVAPPVCSKHYAYPVSRAAQRTHVPAAYKELSAASAVLGSLLAAGVVAASEAGEQHEEPMQLHGQACTWLLAPAPQHPLRTGPRQQRRCLRAALQMSRRLTCHSPLLSRFRWCVETC
jgi:hypothetical protein